MFSACTVHHHYDSKPKKHKSMPPGQKKKVYGTKSAKPFAPGHQKKYKVKPPHKKVKPPHKKRP